VPYDILVSEEERARPIYQAGSEQLTQGRRGSAPFQKCLFPVFILKACLGVFAFLFFPLEEIQGRSGASAGFNAPEV
jgi:hypothetical protein